MRARLFAVACLCLLIAVADSTQVLAAPPQGKRYVDKKAGFRLQLPPGWRRDKKTEKQIPGVLAAFSTRDGSIGFMIFQKVSPQSTEEIRIGLERAYTALFPGLRKVSEEVAVVSGFPSRKSVFAATVEDVASRMWLLVISGGGEHCVLLASGPERLLASADAEGYQQVQQIIDSFEFLEPVLARMKAGLSAPAEKKELSIVAQGDKRFFVNDRVGIRIFLPPDWIMISEVSPSFERPAGVILAKPGSLGKVILARELLEGSPELYVKLVEETIRKNVLAFRLISDEEVSRGGLEGRRLVIVGKESDIEMRYWVEIFSAGKEHFRITATAPEELFEQYPETFNEMMTSVQFPGLSNRLPAALVGSLEQPEAPLVKTKPESGQEQKPTEVEELKQAVVQNPGDLMARRNLGAALLEAGDADGAIAEFQAASRLAPDNPFTHSSLGLAYARKGLDDEAIRSLRKALELNPDLVGVHFILGSIYQKKELYDEAIVSYKKGLKIGPGNSHAYMSLGAVYEAKGLHDKAITSLKKAVKLDPANPQAHLLLGDAYMGKGRNDKALACITKALELKPDYARAHNVMGLVYESKGLPDEAIAEYNKALKIDPDYVWAYRNLGGEYTEKGLYDESISSYAEAVRIEPDSAMNHRLLGGAYLWKGNYEQARKELGIAQELEPGNEFIHRNMAYTYFLEGSLDRASREIEKYFELADSPSVYVMIWQDLILRQLGEREKARRLLEAEAKKATGDKWVLCLLHYHQGQLKESELLSRAQDDKEKQCEAFFYVGYHYLLQGDKQKAREYFQRSFDTKVYGYYEYIGARARLEEMERE
jgi:tetratricopeptide (TPR) repeat protein